MIKLNDNLLKKNQINDNLLKKNQINNNLFNETYIKMIKIYNHGKMYNLPLVSSSLLICLRRYLS